jgi:catenin alpha
LCVIVYEPPRIALYLLKNMFSLQSPIVVWKMKAPEKKPLVRPERPEEVRAKVRKGSQKKIQNPIHALSEFQSPTESV